MATAYRKTPMGLSEVKTRAHGLSPRLRSTLILLDGKRTLEDLQPLVSQGLEESLQTLLDGEYIEAVTVPDRTRVLPVAATRGAKPPPAQPAGGDAEFRAVRREVVRFINEHLGPAAETLAIKMERAGTAAELQPLLPTAAQIIQNVSGAQAASAFRARFIAE